MLTNGRTRKSLHICLEWLAAEHPKKLNDKHFGLFLDVEFSATKKSLFLVHFQPRYRYQAAYLLMKILNRASGK